MSDVFTSLTGGFLENLQLFAATLILAIPLGLIITLGSMSRITPLKWLVRTFIWIIRGTPLMRSCLWFCTRRDFCSTTRCPTCFMAAIVAFVINYACYFSEIFRGGIESIPKGQYEAGQVLGMTRVQIFFKIVLLQVVKRITPAMGNEVITLTKDTSLARVIGLDRGYHGAPTLYEEGPDLTSVLHGNLFPAAEWHPDAVVQLAGEEDGFF